MSHAQTVQYNICVRSGLINKNYYYLDLLIFFQINVEYDFKNCKTSTKVLLFGQ